MSTSAQDMRDRLKRWPLIAQPANRDEGFLKDARLVNAYVEQDPNTGEFWVQKRMGYVPNFLNLITNGIGRGMYTWYHSPGLVPVPENWAIIGNGLNASVFRNGFLFGTALGLPDASGTGIWAFTETQGATKYLVFTSPSPGNLYYTTGSGGWTLATLAAGRGNFITGLAYLDGTVYFMDENCNIFGSNIEDPTTWTTTNLIIAKKIPGTGVAFTRQLSYLLALKSSSMEVFYDGAGAPPGSPLLQIDGATNTFGCLDSNTVQNIDGIVIYATISQGMVSPQIVRIDNLVPTIISTPPIDRLIKSAAVSGHLYSFVFRFGGHRLYGISSDTQNFTVVYDLDQAKPGGLWYQWTDTDGTFFKMQSAGLGNGGIGGVLPWFLTQNSGTIWVLGGDYQYPTDNGVVVPVDIYTGNEDFGTQRTKTMFRMNIRSDVKKGSTLFIRRSDDDYQTWSAYRKVDLGKSTPYIDNEGTFTRRAYNFRHLAPTSFRIRSADLQMELGTI